MYQILSLLMENGKKFTIQYGVTQTLEVGEDQIVSGQNVLNRADSEITSITLAEQLPETLRQEFLDGNLRIFSTDGDGRVIIRVSEQSSVYKNK
jgi:hypothetical protein